MILRTLVSIKRSALTLINGKLPADTKAGKGGLSMDAVIVLLILLFVLLAIGVPVGSPLAAQP